MWSRTQLKIGWCDLLYGGYCCFGTGAREAKSQQVEAYWPMPGDVQAVFSVRSGFDLLLQALELDRGDEVIFSALNVKGMIKIARRMELVPVPVDLDVAHMAPRPGCLEEAVSSRSKVLVVAHLFGSLIDMAPIVAFARRHKLVLIEDCAQVFDGQNYTGHEQADVRMFSFGPLKTATALGGALIVVNDKRLGARMRSIQSGYPVQRRAEQMARVAKFMALKAVTNRYVMGAFYQTFKAFGGEFQDALSNGMRGVAKLGTSRRLRYQPSAALLSLLTRRLRDHAPDILAARGQQARRLAGMIEGQVVLPAAANSIHTYWVFPILADDPALFIAGMRRAGFDAADLPRSQAVEAPEDRPHTRPVVAAAVLRDLVIVPCYPEMPEREIDRLARVVSELAVETGSGRTRAYSKSLKPSKTAV